MDDWRGIIQNEFCKYNAITRISLSQLLKTHNLTRMYEEQFQKLSDITYIVNDKKQIEEIAEFLIQMKQKNHQQVLQKLANISCRYRRNLIDEIIEYHTKKCPSQGSNMPNNNQQSSSNYNQHHANEDEKEKKESEDYNDKPSDQNNSGDGDKDPNKNQKSNKDKYGPLPYIMKRLKQVKNHPKYKQMLQQGKELSDYELISIIYYCDDTLCCRKMKQYHRAFHKDCKWGNLYYHLTHGVNKLHQFFHLNNDNYEEYQILFHGSRACHKLDIWSEHQLFSKTICSFSSSFGIAKG